MAINAGVNVSKLVGFAVLAPNAGVNVTKLVAFAVLTSANVTPPIWPTFSFVNGFVAIAYDQGWDMPTSAPVVTYTVLSGSLPPGLSLAAITGNQAHISGTPTTAGTYSFTLRAVNSFGTADQPFSISISVPLSGGSYIFLS
jgi:hypothetical protein